MENRIKVLASSMSKLYRRGAERNIKKMLLKCHAVDLAEVLMSMETEMRLTLFQWIQNPDIQAEVLSRLNRTGQTEIAHTLDISELQNLLSLMDSDDAADLLGDLPEDLSQSLLSGLRKDELQDVEELMAFPSDSAGGLMGSEFLTLDGSLSVSSAINEIQNQDEENISFYVYVVDSEQMLVGVLSLKQLLLSRPDNRLQEIMASDVISVDVNTDQAEVARIVERYDFLSLPVVDDTRKLVGVITVDDVIDVIREEAAEDLYAMGGIAADYEDSVWQHLMARGPWIFLSLAAGLLGAVTMSRFIDSQAGVLEISKGYAILPLFFFVSDNLCTQTVTSCLGFIRSYAKRGHRWWYFLKKEWLHGLIAISFIGLILSLVFYWAPVLFPFPLSVVGLVVIHLLVTLLFSVGVPWAIHKVSSSDPLLSAPTLATLFSHFAGILLILGYHAFY